MATARSVDGGRTSSFHTFSIREKLKLNNEWTKTCSHDSCDGFLWPSINIDCRQKVINHPGREILYRGPENICR